MAHPTRVRVELRNNGSDSDVGFRRMFAVFKKQVTEAGIIAEWKRCSAYESRGQKRRRKQKEANSLREKEEKLKERLRDHFG
jgi:ribosomal protein S21